MKKSSCVKSQLPLISLESAKESLENGVTKGSSKQSGLPEVCDSSTSQVSTQVSISQKLKSKKSQKSSCTRESLPVNKKTIFKDNKNTSEKMFLTNIVDPNMVSKKSLTSDPESTSRGQDFYEFWDLSKKEMYQQLSWLQGTALPDLDANSSNGCAQSSELKSWFSTLKIQPLNQNLERTLWQSCRFTVVDGMECEDTKVKQKKIVKAFKLRLNPNKEQKESLNSWAGCSRFLYNKTVSMLTNPKNKTLKDKMKLRNRLVTYQRRGGENPNSFYNNKPWLLKCPKNIRAGAVFEACANLKACFSNLKAKNIKHFTSPYRTKKKEQSNGWSISVEKASVKKEGDSLFVCKDVLKEMRYFGTKQLHKLMPKEHPEMDCKIQKTKFGEYFLILPVEKTLKPEKKECLNPVAIDPGVRKYLTTYAPNSQESFMMGNRWSTRVTSLLIQLDKMYSERAKKETEESKKKKHAERIKRIRKKVFYLKKEMKDQCAHFLASRYDLVMMPKLETAKMCIKKDRKLKTKTVRSMLQTGHGEFFNKLKEKCLEQGSTFMEVKEHYTSQTCPCCGQLNKCNEVYHCKKCGFKHDRDLVGSLNIFLKAVRKINPLSE